MKRSNVIIVILSLGLLPLLCIPVYAQAPQKFSFQTVVRDSDGLVVSSEIGLRISISQGGLDGTTIYSETHEVNTDANGVASLEIGTGSTTDSFSSISWSEGNLFIHIEVDLNGGSNYTLQGGNQLLSVPYALHAESATSAIESDPVYGESIASSITTSDVANWNDKLETELDSSITNEIQVLSIDNDSLFLSKGGGSVKLPAAIETPLPESNDFDFSYPDGFQLDSIVFGTNVTSFQVPIGKNFYIMDWRSNYFFFTIDGDASFDGYGRRETAPSAQFVLGEGMLLEVQTDPGQPINLHGFFTDADIQYIAVNLNSGSYSVPDGKVLIVAYFGGGTFQINGSNFFGRFVGPGLTVTGDASFLGYLLDK